MGNCISAQAQQTHEGDEPVQHRVLLVRHQPGRRSKRTSNRKQATPSQVHADASDRSTPTGALQDDQPQFPEIPTDLEPATGSTGQALAASAVVAGAAVALTFPPPPPCPPTLAELDDAAGSIATPSYQAPYIPPAASIPLSTPTPTPWQPSSRRAVVIASGTYSSSGKTLTTLAADANALVQALVRDAGFAKSQLVFLHDAAPPARAPTRAHVRGAIHWLLDGAAPGASLLLVFVGPALLPADTWPTADVNTNSLQGFVFADEKSNLTLELRALLQSTTLPPGCRLHCLIDTVSGVVPVDLVSTAVVRGNGVPGWQGQPDEASEEEEDDDEDGTLTTPRAAVPAMPPPTEGELVLLHAAKGVLTDSAVEEDEDAPAVGSLCFGLTQALEQGQAGSYAALLRAMRLALRNGPSQYAHKDVALEASVLFDLRRGFVL